MIIWSILSIVIANYCLVEFFKSNGIENLQMIFMGGNIFASLIATLIVLAVLWSLYTLIIMSLKRQRFIFLIGFIPLFLVVCFAMIYIWATIGNLSMMLLLKEIFGLDLIMVYLFNSIGLSLYIAHKRKKTE